MVLGRRKNRKKKNLFFKKKENIRAPLSITRLLTLQVFHVRRRDQLNCAYGPATDKRLSRRKKREEKGTHEPVLRRVMVADQFLTLANSVA